MAAISQLNNHQLSCRRSEISDRRCYGRYYRIIESEMRQKRVSNAMNESINLPVNVGGIRIEFHH